MSTAMSDAAIEALTRQGIATLAARIREGEISAERLALHYQARIRRGEPRIRAWAWIDDAAMLQAARSADDALRTGPCGPLHGIPIGVKDVIHTRGIPTRMGSPIFEHFVPDTSAECVQRLESAGAYVQGKTVTTEFASQSPGVTANPWNPTCTPGGSSSGSAAAVAAGFSPAALGTQTRGSLIRPAAFCGVVGYKPSFGAISRHGVHALSAALDHVGVLGRSVDDVALLAATLAGPHPHDAGTLPANAHPIPPIPAMLSAPPRLAAIRSPAWPLAELSQRGRFEADCVRLQRAGAHVEALELPASFDQAASHVRTIQLFDIARNFRSLRATSGDRMSPTFRALCDRGAQISRTQYDEAMAARAALSAELTASYGDFDAILTPPSTGEAPATLETTGDAAFCSIWTLCGLPCVALPTGLGGRNLPLGLQVVGTGPADAQTLAVAKWCAAQLPFPHLPPS